MCKFSQVIFIAAFLFGSVPSFAEDAPHGTPKQRYKTLSKLMRQWANAWGVDGIDKAKKEIWRLTQQEWTPEETLDTLRYWLTHDPKRYEKLLSDTGMCLWHLYFETVIDPETNQAKEEKLNELLTLIKDREQPQTLRSALLRELSKCPLSFTQAEKLYETCVSIIKDDKEDEALIQWATWAATGSIATMYIDVLIDDPGPVFTRKDTRRYWTDRSTKYDNALTPWYTDKYFILEEAHWDKASEEGLKKIATLKERISQLIPIVEVATKNDKVKWNFVHDSSLKYTPLLPEEVVQEVERWDAARDQAIRERYKKRQPAPADEQEPEEDMFGITKAELEQYRRMSPEQVWAKMRKLVIPFLKEEPTEREMTAAEEVAEEVENMAMCLSMKQVLDASRLAAKEMIDKLPAEEISTGVMAEMALILFYDALPMVVDREGESYSYADEMLKILSSPEEPRLLRFAVLDWLDGTTIPKTDRQMEAFDKALEAIVSGNKEDVGLRAEAGLVLVQHTHSGYSEILEKDPAYRRRAEKGEFRHKSAVEYFAAHEDELLDMTRQALAEERKRIEALAVLFESAAKNCGNEDLRKEFSERAQSLRKDFLHQ